MQNRYFSRYLLSPEARAISGRYGAQTEPMKEVLIWTQGGVKNVIFSRSVLSIVESANNKEYCDISVDFTDDPYSTLNFS